MSYAETLLPEFDQEMANTRKVLERIPDDKLDWQAHPKSHTIGWNANHVADIPNWLVMVLTTASLDIAPVDGEPYLAAEADQPARRSSTSSTGTSRPRGRRSPRPRTRTWAALDAVAGRPADLHHAAGGRGPEMVLNHLIHHRAHLASTSA